MDIGVQGYFNLGDIVKYVTHLENTLKKHCNMDDETLKHVRACYMSPGTNEVLELLEEETK